MGVIVLLSLVVVVVGGDVKPTPIVLLPVAGLGEPTMSTNYCFCCCLTQLSATAFAAAYDPMGGGGPDGSGGRAGGADLALFILF